MWSAPRTFARFSAFTSPTIRTASPGPGNGWRWTISSGRPELGADRADLVLEQVAQRLDELEVHVLGQPADVVVALDVGRGLRAGLDHVRVQRALHEEPRAGVLARDLLEDADELLADRLALGLGIGHPGELREEPVLGLHVDERHVEVPRERLLDLLGLPLAVQPVVDEHAGQLVADRAVDEQRRHAESTPPESAQSTSASPTCSRIRWTCSSMMFVGVQSGSSPQPS